jgi:hypothetical protein
MADKHRKRPSDPNQVGKLVVAETRCIRREKMAIPESPIPAADRRAAPKAIT